MNTDQRIYNANTIKLNNNQLRITFMKLLPMKGNRNFVHIKHDTINLRKIIKL